MGEHTERRVEEGCFAGFDLVHVYSRAEAIDDGTLIDVTGVARGMGFRYPTAITHAAWWDCVAWEADESERKGIAQDQDQRLRHVLGRLLSAIRTRASASDDQIFFDVLRVSREGTSSEMQAVSLMSVCGPGDTAEPVVTIGFPGED